MELQNERSTSYKALPYNYVLTADIGGSHITGAICECNENTVIKSTLCRAEFSSKASAENILNSWASVLWQVIKKAKGYPTKMGIAMPGPFDYQAGISYIRGLKKYECLYGLNIKQYLSDALMISQEDIRFRNDAEAALAGETLSGSATDFPSALGLTLGTGFGTAHFQNGRTTDLNWGSFPFLKSIADDHLSSRWFLKRYHEITGLSVIGVKDLAVVAKDNYSARRVFKEFADNLCLFLERHLNKCSPEIIILSGNIAKSHKYFLPELKRHFSKITIELGHLGEDAALLGAAELFSEDFISASIY